MDIQIHRNELSERVQNLINRASEYIEVAEAYNTKRAHQSDWEQFEQWCEQMGLCAMPADPQTIALYLTFLADNGYMVSSIERKKSSISAAHRAKGFDSPVSNALVKKVFDGIKRTLGVRNRPKKALIVDDLKKLLDQVPNTIHGIRDRALLLMGFAGGFRRTALVSLNVEDIEITNEGMIVFVDRDKNDQNGEGRTFAIANGKNKETCPVCAYVRWIEFAKIKSGAVFRRIMRHSNVIGERLNSKEVERIVKKYAKKAGLNASEFAAHSLRSGFVTTAAKAGKDYLSIMEITGHKSVSTLKRYYHDGNLFKNNATMGIGL
jgi:site-specific recombinase XerD